jgi:hypothetical protein
VERIRYRIDIVVQTPSGDRTSSGVLSISSQQFRTLEGSGRATRTLMDGTAIPIDLPGKPSIWMTIGIKGFDWPSASPWSARRMDPGQKVLMEYQTTPLFVTFTDESNPATARLVPYDDFSKVLGKGYGLKGVYVSTTQDKRSDFVSSRLPWVRDMMGQLDGQRRGFMNLETDDVTKYMGKEYFYRET